MAPANRTRFQLEGAGQLDRALSQLPKSLSRGVLRRSLTKAAEPVRDAAQQNVPVRTGELRDSLAVATRLTPSQRRLQTRAGGVVVYVGASWPQGAHAHLVEFGTAHSAAQPFLRPAWDQHGAKVLPAFGEEVWQQLDRTAKRLAMQAEKGRLSRTSQRALRK